MDITRVLESVGRQWQESITERLTAYVRIPNKSPMFDPDWEKHGYMDQAANLIADWCRAAADRRDEGRGAQAAWAHASRVCRRTRRCA